jgi:phosphoglycerate dehydrogenase-like enzyme
MTYRCAILDDYQNVALSPADWSTFANDVQIVAFQKPLKDSQELATALRDFDIVFAMRERTPFPADVINTLPTLKSLITTGMANKSIDVAACKARGVSVCGTQGVGNPTLGITFGLMLELTRKIGFENARMKRGEFWQSTIRPDLEGLTLGIIGLGRIGRRVATVAKGFGMKVAAWSPNMTPERAEAEGVEFLAKDDLMRRSDIITIHMQLSDRSAGLLSDRELRLMKPTAYLINTSRAPIVDEPALISALSERRVAGAGLDVFSAERLPLDHPFRKLDNVVVSPHMGYVSLQNYKKMFSDVVEDIRAFVDGKSVPDS